MAKRKNTLEFPRGCLNGREGLGKRGGAERDIKQERKREREGGKKESERRGIRRGVRFSTKPIIICDLRCTATVRGLGPLGMPNSTKGHHRAK